MSRFPFPSVLLFDARYAFAVAALLRSAAKEARAIAAMETGRAKYKATAAAIELRLLAEDYAGVGVEKGRAWAKAVR